MSEASTGPVWLTEQDVVELVDMPTAIDALEQMIPLEVTGGAKNMGKSHVRWGGGDTLHAIGAVLDGEGVAGTKTWAHVAGGAMPLLVLFDSRTGALLAIVEAFALGQLRTGGISGVATRHMAKQDAAELAIVGTGHQAIAQVAAVAAVRTLSRVRVHSRDTERRRDFAKRVGDVLGLDTTVHNTVSECIHGAPIVTLVTRATEPFLQAPDVARGAHMNAIGAIVPDRAEFDPDLLGRCSLISADDVDSVRRLSREVRQWCAVDDRRWEQVRPISEVLAGAWRRNDADDVTLFKAMGMGLSDLAIGVHCLDQARRRGMGRPVPRPSRTTPRLGGVPVTVEESRA